MTDVDLRSRLHADGFAFTTSAATRDLLGAHGSLSDWDTFAASWGDLGLDTYMADGGRYRKRRHAALRAPRGQPIARKPHQPHYQSRDYNPLNGGVARWFEPVAPVVADSRSLAAILGTCRAVFDALTPDVDWHIELHQFRIEARAGTAGQPTPEGRHQDGVDHVLVLLVSRQNVASGETTIHALDGTALGSFTLAAPLDAAWVDDHRVLHGVTPVTPLDAGMPGFRDVLVVTFRRE